MNLKNRIILEDYRKKKDSFVELGEVVHELLKKETAKLNISIMAIEHRVKSEESLAGKLERADKYQKLEDLTDILGLRIICFFNDEVDVIGKIVEENFVIDWKNSCDKRKLIATDSFGYLSLHYICSLDENSGYPEHICGKKFEIQIRTNLQHTWAQIEHDLGYKSEFGVPRVVQRNFSRIAGMLELIDDEFVRTRDQMISYTESVRQKIIDNCADEVVIDNVSLFEYVKRNKNMKEFLEQLSKISNAEISEVNPNGYIDQLAWFGIRTLGGMQKMMEENSSLALEMAKFSLENSQLDIVSSNVGLRYLCRAKLINDNYSESKVIEFLKLSIGNEKVAERQAKYLLKNKK